KYTEKDFPEVIEQHLLKFNYIKRKVKKIPQGDLTKNTRIAVKEKANIIDIFSPINFYILTQLKKHIGNDIEMKFILSSVLHLLKLTDIKSQSQFPYWVPKKNILDRNIFHSLYKKAKELKNYVNEDEIPIYSHFSDLMKASVSSCYLINKPIQKLRKSDVPDASVDVVITDPPYFDQVAYSEYLKIWEYFLGLKSFFKDELIQSQRAIQTSTEEDYLKSMKESFLVIRKKMKKNGKLFVYFKDSRPKKVQKFLEIMREIGLNLSSQEHVLKKKYTYKQNTTTDTTIVGECLMQFSKSKKLAKIDVKKEKNILNVESIIKKYVTDYLIQNKTATIGALYNNGLLKVLYENNSLSLIKDTKSMNKILGSFCEYEDKRRTFSLKKISFKNKLIHGDSIKILKLIPDGSVDCCITDPPYNISGYDHKKEIGWYKSNKIWTKVKKFNKINEEWDKFSDLSYSDFTYEWISQIKRIVKPNGNIAIFGSLHNIYKIGAILEELDLKIINSIIWFKRNAFPNITQRMFCESTEQIIWATNNSKKYAKNWTFNYNVMKELNNMKQMRNMWDIPNTPKSEKEFGKFPAQKSEKVLDRLVKALTNEGDIIIDPFLGSGTTAVATKKNDRHYIGIDNNKDYLGIAKKRLSKPKSTSQLSFEDLSL
ncbi:MAG: DNA methyltransferase, partial [Oligoflexia bacterium]|nr:DNA methyltransferase [Oligoflexia bacterium]